MPPSSTADIIASLFPQLALWATKMPPISSALIEISTADLAVIFADLYFVGAIYCGLWQIPLRVSTEFADICLQLQKFIAFSL